MTGFYYHIKPNNFSLSTFNLSFTLEDFYLVRAYLHETHKVHDVSYFLLES